MYQVTLSTDNHITCLIALADRMHVCRNEIKNVSEGPLTSNAKMDLINYWQGKFDDAHSAYSEISNAKITTEVEPNAPLKYQPTIQSN